MRQDRDMRFAPPPINRGSRGRSPSRLARPRRGIAAAALATLSAALLAALAGPASPAWADVIQFDPRRDQVPAILDLDDMARYDLLRGRRFVGMDSGPSPDGARLLGFFGGTQGFVDLRSGVITPLDAGAQVPGFPITGNSWLDATTLATLHVEVVPKPDGPPDYKYHRVAWNAATGRAVVTPVQVNVDGGPGAIVAVAPDLSRLLAMEFPTENPPPARTVTVGPTFGGPEADLPVDLPPGVESLGELPGAIDRQPGRTLEVQQVSFKLVLQSLDGASRRELVSAPAESSLWSLSWSDDSQRLAFTLATMPGWDGDRGRDNDPPPAGLPNLGSINVQEALGNVAPADNPLVTGTRVHVFDMTGAEVKQFKNADFQQGMLQGVLFSPTRKHALLNIAVRSALRDRTHPTYAYPKGQEWHLMDANLQVIKKIEVPGSDALVGSVGFAGDDEILFGTPNDLDARITAYDVASGQSRVLWDQPGAIYQVMSGGGAAVFSHTTVDAPLELWTLGTWAGGATPAPRQLTSVNRAVRFGSALRWAEVAWKSSDGQDMRGIYVYPETMAFPPAQPGPVVVWQAGGPGGQMANAFGASVESTYSLLPNFGIPVFIANAAGRNVKSAQFYADMAEGRNFGQLDIQQVKEGVDHLVSQRIVDPRRVGITGCSYGGYFTLQSLRAYPGYYAAGNPQCSLADLFEEFNFGYTPFISYLMGRGPLADPAEYAKDSPMYGTKDIRTPTLIFHGTKDFLPVPLINNIHDQIAANGVAVKLFRAVGYGHGLGGATDDNDDFVPGSDLSGQRYAFQLQLQFFRERLGVDKVTIPLRTTTIHLPALHNGMAAGEPAR